MEPPQLLITELKKTIVLSSHWSLMLPILLYSCLAPSLTPFSYSYPLVTIDHFSTCVILSFWECYISEITQNIPFWDWLCSRSLIPLRSIQMVACLSSFFSLLPSSIPWYRHTTFCLNIHPLKSIWVIFWLLQIKLLWTFVYVSLLSLCGHFFFFFFCFWSISWASR